MLLSIKNRKIYLRHLKLYSGKINDIEDDELKQAYIEFQNQYFIRKKDKDGVYGNNTDILLRNAYNVSKYTKNFTLNEFECGCHGKYCTGHPARLNRQLLKNLQVIRDEFGPTTISSGLRCKRYNNSLPGSSTVSEHMKGWAVDFYNDKTRTYIQRKKVMNVWKKQIRAGYTYCNDPKNTYPNMGIAVHVQVTK